MNDGKQSELMLETIQHDQLDDHLHLYASWLLSDPRTLEVWGLISARLARVECVTEESQSLELDSGDWFLMRVSGLPTTVDRLPTTAVKGIVRFRRIVGKESQKLKRSILPPT